MTDVVEEIRTHLMARVPGTAVFTHPGKESRITIEQGTEPGMAKWPKRLFIALVHNAASPAMYFQASRRPHRDHRLPHRSVTADPRPTPMPGHHTSGGNSTAAAVLGVKATLPRNISRQHLAVPCSSGPRR